MCGHVGVMGPLLQAKHEDAIEDGLFICGLRGTDSLGVGVVPVNRKEEAPFVQKRCGSAPFYLTLPLGGAKVVIGHTRSATIGGINRDLAHPFIYQNIIGAHNGTLRGEWRKALEDQTNERFGSDSQAIFYNFAYWGVEETISSIQGAWCLVWWDDDNNTLNMLRNDERPLWTARGKDGELFWASEHWMINGMLRAGERDRAKLVKTPTADGKSELFFHKLPSNVWRRYTFDDNGEVIIKDETELKGMAPPVAAVKEESRPPFTLIQGGLTPETGFVYAEWKNNTWVESSTPVAGGLKVPQKFIGGLGNAKGELYRVVNGVAYVSKPGVSHEISFKELIEFRTDGTCCSCNTLIQHPVEIGYLPDDFSWIACRDCCKDWMGLDADGDWSSLMQMLDGTEDRVEGNPVLEPVADADLAGDYDIETERAYAAAVERERETEREALFVADPDLARRARRRADATAALGPVLNELGTRSSMSNEDWDETSIPFDDDFEGDFEDDFDDDLPVDLADCLPPALLAKVLTMPKPIPRNLDKWNWWERNRETRR